jgi:hypothetical protein
MGSQFVRQNYQPTTLEASFPSTNQALQWCPGADPHLAPKLLARLENPCAIFALYHQPSRHIETEVNSVPLPTSRQRKRRQKIANRVTRNDGVGWPTPSGATSISAIISSIYLESALIRRTLYVEPVGTEGALLLVFV